MTYLIYYGDNSIYRGNNGPAHDAPGQNVQVIVQSDEITGWHSLSGHHNYWFEDGIWFGGNDFGLFDYLIRPGWKKVIFGRTISNAEFQEICRAAQAEASLLAKSGYWKWERRP